ncbi:MAG: hypothetical protein ACREEB_05760 [Caulobacteraceae bacterium]
MSPQELEAYRRWFIENIPVRTAALEHAVTSSPGFENWTPDLSPASLEMLGSWLAHQVESRARTADEVYRIRQRATFDIDIPREELTDRTFSLAIDVGMYFGETLFRHCANLEWKQLLKGKDFADFGQMALLGFGRAPLNPVRIVVILCYGIASGKHTGKRLKELYDYWSKLAVNAGKVA